MNNIKHFFHVITSYLIIAITFAGGFLTAAFFFFVIFPLIFVQWLDPKNDFVAFIMGIIALTPAFLILALILSPLWFLFS